MALESPRGSLLTVPGAVRPAGTSVLWGWIWVGESDIRAALGPQLGSCCPAIFIFSYFIFFCFLVESQGKLRLGIQNSSVSLDLKKKQTLDMVRGSISKVFIFSFVLEHS